MINAILISFMRNTLLVVGIGALVLLNTAVWADDSGAATSCPTLSQTDTPTLASPTTTESVSADRARL